MPRSGPPPAVGARRRRPRRRAPRPDPRRPGVRHRAVPAPAHRRLR